ncbi:30S ribosomal protein S18 [bacterium]|nr:30S ribosomal protein S18 [bacterium]
MASDQDASNAISQLNGFNLDGRNIKVTEDRNAGGRPQGGRSFAPREDRRFNNNGPRRDFQNGSQFRQQAAQNDTRRRKKVDPFEEDETLFVDYKDARYLKRFMSERGKILPRRLTGLTSHNQRAVSRAIKRAQHIALLPYSGS